MHRATLVRLNMPTVSNCMAQKLLVYWLENISREKEVQGGRGLSKMSSRRSTRLPNTRKGYKARRACYRSSINSFSSLYLPRVLQKHLSPRFLSSKHLTGDCHHSDGAGKDQQVTSKRQVSEVWCRICHSTKTARIRAPLRVTRAPLQIEIRNRKRLLSSKVKSGLLANP
jgi:hypothetical protein